MNKLIKNWLQHSFTLSLSLPEPKNIVIIDHNVMDACFFFFLTFYLHRILFTNSKSAFSFDFFVRVRLWSCADLGMSESIFCIPSRSIHCFLLLQWNTHVRRSFLFFGVLLLCVYSSSLFQFVHE